MYLEEKIDELNQKVDRMLVLMGDAEQCMTIQDIANMLHVSRQALYTNKRYLLPDFGRSLKKGKKYTRSEVAAWNAKGEKKLYEEWKQIKEM